MKLILVRGAPGTGKTTFVNRVFSGIFHVENDMWHMKGGKYAFDAKSQPKAVTWCVNMCEHALAEGMDAVVSNTFTKARYIDVYRRLAEKYGADFTVYRMHGDFKNSHSVPETVLKNMRENFADWPDEINAYPNLNQDPCDPCYRPYMLTELKVGDKIELTHYAEAYSGVMTPRTCSATVTKIMQGTYDYLNVFYREDVTGKEGLCMSGDCTRLPADK